MNDRITSHRPSNRVFSIGTALLALLVIGLPAAALEENLSFSTDRLYVRSLIGEVKVEGHRGSDFDVQVQINGRDARRGLVVLERERGRLTIDFDTDTSDFVYPPLGSERTRNRGGKDRRRLNVSGSGSGLEVWTDITIRVPTGSELELEHSVGKVNVASVDGELDLSTRSGDLDIDDVRGRVRVSTGSGEVMVRRASGDEIHVATGSGDVDVERSDAEEVHVATGSGSISLRELDARAVELATGSGDVSAMRMQSDRMSVGTGSGDVEVVLDRMGGGRFSVGTGSGDIVLAMPRGAGADIHAETDGSIRVELDEEPVYRLKEIDEVRMTVGGGGAEVDLGSGSGTIRIRN